LLGELKDNMQAKTAPIRIVNCAKTFRDGTQALRSTNLNIEAGEILALLGPSGCGKTTLLRIIAGLESPDPGTQIWFGDDEVTHLPVEKRSVGMVFQHYALFPRMNVSANIGYGLRIRGKPALEIEAQVNELIELVQLHGLEKRMPAELSGGQRQRVALARALAVQPKVLLLDEPLTALDAKLKEALRDELGELLRRLGITAIHVTHDQIEAMAVADRLAVMSEGRVVQLGSSDELYNQPVNSFVAAFMGPVNTVPMQLIQGDSSSQSNGLNGRYGVSWGGQWHASAQPSAQIEQAFLRPHDIVVTKSENPIKVGEVAYRITERKSFGNRAQMKVIAIADGTHPKELRIENADVSAWQNEQIVHLSLKPNSIIFCKNS
jgi:putative spermidine/putrescine transport system ATP-binding protein